MSYVGIDLGTTFSAVAYLDPNGTPFTVLNAEGELTTPSVVLFEESGDVVVGREARRAALVEPERTVECVKRYMGEETFPRRMNGKELTPVEISAHILRKLKQDTEQKIGKVEGAVITVPAYFDEARRQATAAAGEHAGLKVMDIVNEPTAAALAYAFRGLVSSAGADAAAEMRRQKPRVLVVYDLGGGTFDVTVLRGGGEEVTVLATAGDIRLGGRDWDERLYDHMANVFLSRAVGLARSVKTAHDDRARGLDPREDPMSRQALMLAAEEAKKVLSQRKQTKFVVSHAGRTFGGELTREQFAQMTEDLLYRTESRLLRVLKQAHLTWEQVDEVLAVGGSTRMPQVVDMLRRVTGGEPNCSLSPDEVVAHGAAIHAAMCLVKSVAPGPARAPAAAVTAGPAKPESVRAPAASAKPSIVPLAARPHAAPALARTPAALAAAKPDAPPAVANGNGMPAPMPEEGVLALFKRKVLDILRSVRTTNVNSHSLGVVAKRRDGSERVVVLIPANTQLPVSIKKRFGTVADNQRDVMVTVVEGESRRKEECIPVGSCRVQPLPAGMPRGSEIEVTFTYDNSGRLHIEAMDVRSGAWAKTMIERHAGIARKPLDLDGRGERARPSN